MKKKSGVENGGNAAAGPSSVVMWDRFLPKMVVRVLLVEADDSTRQIIAALLRKCSYKVAAVSDGLKAWEVLKERANNIDLILTEVELPSISGYALLTLIMEHHVCKNIPVIMMSTHDSVSTVYKCMLRGASDFLVKPVRKNELRNLWQHVWRKQVTSRVAGPGPAGNVVAQQEVEAMAENNAVSNEHASGYMACDIRNRECVEKESDAQSSCTKPEFEVDAAGIQQTSFPRLSKNSINIHSKEECHQERRKTQPCDVESRTVAEQDTGYENAENNEMNQNSSGKAIDLIAAFDNYLQGNFGSSASNAGADKLDNSPVLDLSLRRSHLSVSVNQAEAENQRLNHSDMSAFSRYRNKACQPSFSKMPSPSNLQKDQEINSVRRQSNYILDRTSETHAPAITSQRLVSIANIESGQPQISLSHLQQGNVSLPISVKGARFHNAVNSYASVMPAIYSTQSGLSPLPSPGSAHQHSEPFPRLCSFYPLERQPSIPNQFHNPMGRSIINAIDQIDNHQRQRLENLDDQRNGYPENDQRCNSSFCNGNIIQHYGTCSGSNAKIDSVSVVKGPAECCNEEIYHAYDEGASHRYMQREAALTKFRLKRKDRCFEKKVRYESRKKLAEQRPRVKGQFVRQAPNDTQPENSSD